MTRIAYVNGLFLPLEEARVSVLDRGFLLADGIYEVTCVIDGGLVDFDGHMARLERSAKEIGMGLPLGAEELRRLHRELVARNGLGEGAVYIQVTRGVAERDFAFPAKTEQTVVMFTQARDLVAPPAAKTGIRAVSVPDIRWARRDIKSVALLAQVLAKQAAAEAGASEAVMHEGGTVTEGASSNIWIVSEGGALVTRQLSRAILSGITRQTVQRLAAETGVAVEERAFTLDEAFAAREMFQTAATALVMPIVELDGRKIGDGAPGPLTLRMRALYIEAARAAAASGS